MKEEKGEFGSIGGRKKVDGDKKIERREGKIESHMGDSL
jgi:hypothetical protein